MTIAFTELRQLGFADRMYQRLVPDQAGEPGQTESLYQFLWKKIVDQELRPGDRVLDTAIAVEAGVSRTPVREAIQRLIQEGLLEELPRGVRVPLLTVAAIDSLYDYRIALETFAARQTAADLPEAQVQHLLLEGEAVRARLRAPGGDHDPLAAVELMRHGAGVHGLLRPAGNPYLARGIAAVHARLSPLTVAGTRVPGGRVAGLDEHEAILRALLARDPDAAGAAVEAHLLRVKEHAVSHLAGAAALHQPRRVATDK